MNIGQLFLKRTGERRQRFNRRSRLLCVGMLHVYCAAVINVSVSSDVTVIVNHFTYGFFNCVVNDNFLQLCKTVHHLLRHVRAVEDDVRLRV